jgi:hypothetical protein
VLFALALAAISSLQHTHGHFSQSSRPPAAVTAAPACRLRLRGGGSAGAELVFPGGGVDAVVDAVRIATALRRPIQIQRGVHRW